MMIMLGLRGVSAERIERGARPTARPVAYWPALVR